MKLGLSILIAVAITLPLAVGCTPAAPVDQVCGQLIDCYGDLLPAEQKAQATESCPAAMTVLLLASPDCYACLADSGCDAIFTCGGTCTNALYQYFPELKPE
jgi:hypothetical protein